ncbi:hypothetical protein [Parapedobacter tibetensis]|uniref:hypothetical protein n=1 Tax=Parapedobacter tibetensis TaxID=2972951 RepID=UPI00214DDD11|nr:hypothetical protein [Parapedobacter tibetensis]
MDELFKNEIPKWDFRKRFNVDHDGKGWKREPSLLRAEALYEQSRKVYHIAKLFCETLVGDQADLTTELIMENALMIPPKIIGAEGGDLYILRMENAAIIRLHGRQLREQVDFAEARGMGKTEYTKLLKIELEKFRHLFVNWVDAFEKDEVEDDWGLF